MATKFENFEVGPATTSQAERVSGVSRGVDLKNTETPAQQRLGPSNQECYRGGNDGHEADACPFTNSMCYQCGQVGHIRRMCERKRAPRDRPVARRAKGNGPVAEVAVDGDFDVDGNFDDPGSVDNVRGVQATGGTEGEGEAITAPRYLIKLAIKHDDWKRSFDWRQTIFELDSGSSATVINSRIWEALGSPALGSPALAKPATNFASCSGHSLPVVGQFKRNVQFGRQTHKQLPRLVLDDDRLPIVGWLGCDKMGLKSTHCYRSKRESEAVGRIALKDRQERATLGKKFRKFDGGNGGAERKSGRADGGARRKRGRAGEEESYKAEDRGRKLQRQQAPKLDQKLRFLHPGETPLWVWSRKYDKVKWAASTTSRHTAPLTHPVDVSSKIGKRHIDRVTNRNPKCVNSEEETDWRQFWSDPVPAPVVKSAPAQVEERPLSEAVVAPAPEAAVLRHWHQRWKTAMLRRSTRPRKPIIRYDASVYHHKKK